VIRAFLRVLAPSLTFLANTGDDVNENSIVVMLRYDGSRVLFMGDAGEAAEARLLASGDDLHADAGLCSIYEFQVRSGLV
jgi:beta-lactamase superfamily II metal-dependent hydrolase